MARAGFRRAALAALPAALVLAAPSAADAPTYDPPRWFEQAVAKVKARAGAKCPAPRSSTRDFDAGGQPLRQERIDQNCRHRLPKAFATSFPVLREPGWFHRRYREGCHGETFRLGNPDGTGNVTEEIYFRCDIWYRPVIRGEPNARSWQCWRSRWTQHEHDETGGHVSRAGKPFWFAEETKLWRGQRFRTLRACLNPRLREPK
jgi:hypothetical protein